jgi:hypothetical protein
MSKFVGGDSETNIKFSEGTAAPQINKVWDKSKTISIAQLL